MFKVELHMDGRSWYGLNFEFELMEEAQEFVKSALEHFIKKGDDEDESEEDVLIASIKYSQKFSTAEEEEDESNTCD